MTVSCFVFSQNKIQGKVIDSDTGESIASVEVYLTQSVDLWQNEDGDYIVSNLKKGFYEIVFYSQGYALDRKKIEITNKNLTLNISLKPLGEELSEVVVNSKKKETFGMLKLKDVQGVAIYAGKKSELILMNNMVANLATNNPRQIYAKVAGLNIWESDSAGLQLGIGGRGLDPNRSSNFNVRQNGYDISADALGYPESYYTPPSEALEQIEIVRGAASLQYGTQFGGLLNFKIKEPVQNKEFSIYTSQSIGSFGLFNSFNNISGTIDKFGYHIYFNYKKGDGYRPNSDFYQTNIYADLRYNINSKTKIRADITLMNYLAHQSGGLSDQMFEEDATQSNRERNWFEVNWNLFALHFDHKFTENTKLNIRAFTLDASRKAIGYRNYRPSTIDPNKERELIIGKFDTFGTEARVLTEYDLNDNKNTLLLGGRYYKGNNTSEQGLGSDGLGADFSFIDVDQYISQDFYEQVNINSSNYKYPNENIAFFVENIFNINDNISITPGLRYEIIKTKAIGSYRVVASNLAGDIRSDETIYENEKLNRNFLLMGVGSSYKPTDNTELYFNISQNYRSVTFSDIRIVNPNSLVDPDIKDEKGYSADLGIRGKYKKLISYDFTLFYLNYQDRLGDILIEDPSTHILKRMRTNIGKADIYGLESLIQYKIINNRKIRLGGFFNTTFINAEYTEQYYAKTSSKIEGNRVEFVPNINFKTGLEFEYKKLASTLQYSYLSQQFTDATNSYSQGGTGVVGEIPSYSVMDLSFSYRIHDFKINTGINNLLDNKYFTRRATGYPGPGIIPSDSRSFYLSVGFKY